MKILKLTLVFAALLVGIAGFLFGIMQNRARLIQIANSEASQFGLVATILVDHDGNARKNEKAVEIAKEILAQQTISAGLKASQMSDHARQRVLANVKELEKSQDVTTGIPDKGSMRWADKTRACLLSHARSKSDKCVFYEKSESDSVTGNKH